MSRLFRWPGDIHRCGAGGKILSRPNPVRTYSAEVTGFRRNLPHHRSAPIQALNNNTTKSTRKSTLISEFFQQKFSYFRENEPTSFGCFYIQKDGYTIYNV